MPVKKLNSNRMSIQHPLGRIVMRRVHAEIEHLKEDNTRVHSDICPPDCSADGLASKEYRELLNKCLDEWLDK